MYKNNDNTLSLFIRTDCGFDFLKDQIHKSLHQMYHDGVLKIMPKELKLTDDNDNELDESVNPDEVSHVLISFYTQEEIDIMEGYKARLPL
jgi:hypothetical protein